MRLQFFPNYATTGKNLMKNNNIEMTKRYSENHLKLAFSISFSMTRTENSPDANAAMAPTTTENQLTYPSAPDLPTSITVNNSEPSITGILKRKENVATC